MKIKILVIAFTIVIILLFLLTRGKTISQTTPKTNNPVSPITSQQVDIKASFEIYTNGLKRDFNLPRYHNLSKDVFIQPSNPSEIIIKKAGITWNDFFKTLPMKLTKDCLITGTGQVFCNTEGQLIFTLNGTKVDNFLDLEIKDQDKALITFKAN